MLCLGGTAVFLQGRDVLEDDVRIGRLQTVRTERKIEEVAMLMRAKRSQSVDDLAAAVGVILGTCYKIRTDDLNRCVTQHSVQLIVTQDQRDDRMTLCGTCSVSPRQDKQKAR